MDSTTLVILFSVMMLFGCGPLRPPPAKLATQYVDEQMLREVAAEHVKGGRLYIGTTALNAQRPVIWDMGGLPSSGHREVF